MSGKHETLLDLGNWPFPWPGGLTNTSKLYSRSLPIFIAKLRRIGLWVNVCSAAGHRCMHGLNCGQARSNRCSNVTPMRAFSLPIAGI
jgi:hypothetical protein